MDNRNTPQRFIRAIRQIMLEKDFAQVVFEPCAYPDPEVIPHMCHYDGAIVPVYTVTMPEAVPEFEDRTTDKMNNGIVLCCEHDGLIHSELLDGSEAPDGVCIEWDRLLCCVYDELIDPQNDPDWDDWLEDFEKALAHGVPAEARALRARLLHAGYSEDNPCDTGKEYSLKQSAFTPHWKSDTDIRFNLVWPESITVMLVDNADGHQVEVRNETDAASESGVTIDCRELLAIHTGDESIRREVLRRTVSALLDGSSEQSPVAVYPKHGPLPADFVTDFPVLKDSFVNGAFQVEGDGIICITFYGAEEPVEFDLVPTAVLEALASELSFREDWLHEIRRILRDYRLRDGNDTPDEHPIDEGTALGEDEAVGLSSLELPRAAGAWLDKEGHITVRLEACEQPLRENALSAGDLKALQAGLLAAEIRARHPNMKV